MFTSSPVALPDNKRFVEGRCLMLVDIENVVGGAVQTAESAITARRIIEGGVQLESTDQVIISSSHFGALHSGLAWKGARLVVRSGPDGADLALLDVLEDESIASRFDRVVIVSGDGIFTDSIAALSALGVEVVVVGHRDGMSRRLRMAASQVIEFEQIALEIGDAA